MATTYGPWVRVAGTDGGASLTGSLTAHIWGPTGLTPSPDGSNTFCFSAFGGCDVSVMGLTVGVHYTVVTDPHGYSTRHFYAQAGANQSSGHTYDVLYTGGFPSPTPPYFTGYDGPQTVGVTFSIAYTGVVLKRRLRYGVPDKRQHMHPRDVGMEDDWFAMPGATATLSVSGDLGGASQTVTINSGTTDIPVARTVTATLAGDGQPYALTDTSVLTCTIGGMNYLFGGGYVTVGPNGSHVTGSGDTLTWTQTAGVEIDSGTVSITSDWPTHVRFNVKATKFDWTDPDALDPLVQAGFVQLQGDGVTTVPYGYTASALNALTGALMRDSGHGLITVVPVDHDHRNLTIAPGTVWMPTQTIAMSLDEGWCLDNQLCPQRTSDLSDSGVALIETMHDRYLVIDGYGADASGSSDPAAHVYASLTQANPALFPLAPDKANPALDPNLRWVQTGDLPTNHDPAQPTKLLRWFLPAALYGDGHAHGGGISLAIQTRYYERLDLLKAWGPGSNPNRNWRWPFMLKKRGAGEKDSGTDEPTYAEDWFSWQGGSFLQFTVNRPKWCDLSLTLTVSYSTVDVQDPHYTSGEWRAEEYDWTRTQASATYTVVIPADASGPYYSGTAPTQGDATAVVDLLCPDDGSTPRLMIVDSVSVTGLSIPVNARGDRPDGYQDGGYLEFCADATLGPKLVQDLGHDHTGRQTTAAPAVDASAVETFDFQADWEAVTSHVNGAPATPTYYPQEPWIDPQGKPEKGLAYIEAVQHSPDYSGEGTELHYARALTDLGIIGWTDCMTLTPAPAVLAALTTDSVGEVLAPGYLYWLTANKRLQNSGTPTQADFNASVRVASWTLAPGMDYVIASQKILMGEARILVKSPTGRQRVTPWYLTATGTAPQYVVFRRVSYVDAVGGPVSDPAGFPASGKWLYLADGSLGTRLSPLGVWASPPLPPSDSRYRDPADPTGPNTHRILTQYFVQIWADGSWSGYDPSDPVQWAAMLAGCQAQYDLGAQAGSRLWQTWALPLAGVQRFDAKMQGGHRLVVVRKATTRWPGGDSWPDAAKVLIDFCARPANPRGPYRTVELGDGDNPCLAVRADWTLLVLTERSGDIDVWLAQPDGSAPEVIMTISGANCANVSPDPFSGEAICLRRSAGGSAKVTRINGRLKTETILADLGSMDATTGYARVTSDGIYEAAVPRAGGIVLYRSADGGTTWAEV